MGPFPPGGKRVELPFMAILRIEDDKIAEMWVEWDNVSILTQLGHLPDPQ
jgi:predicted ester cyclase